jgi:hypothetical protein
MLLHNPNVEAQNQLTRCVVLHGTLLLQPAFLN